MNITPPKFGATEQTEIQDDIEMQEEEEQQPQIQQQQSAPAPVIAEPVQTVAQICPQYDNHEETESIISNSEESEYVDNYRQTVLKKVNDEIMQNEEVVQPKPVITAPAPAPVIEEEEEPAFVEPSIIQSQNV